MSRPSLQAFTNRFMYSCRKYPTLFKSAYDVHNDDVVRGADLENRKGLHHAGRRYRAIAMLHALHMRIDIKAVNGDRFRQWVLSPLVPFVTILFRPFKRCQVPDYLIVRFHGYKLCNAQHVTRETSLRFFGKPVREEGTWY